MYYQQDIFFDLTWNKNRKSSYLYVPAHNDHSLPDSVKDIKALYHSINELDLRGKILVLDRGFFSEGTIKFLRGKKNSYVLPAGTEDALPETGRARNREGKIQYMNEEGRTQS